MHDREQQAGSLPGPPGGQKWPRSSRIVAALGVLAVLYGALLRFDALTAVYGPVTGPSWLRAVQETRVGPSALRPAAITWPPEPTYPHADGRWTRYISDPYTYLQYAREMRSFYAAHRREPLFPFATKVALLLLDDQDVAVSFMSAAFSLLVIGATLLLGWKAFSPWVGLGAALAMALEFEVVSWSVRGWRDDAFTAAVVLSAWAMLRYAGAPTRANASILGAVGGLACLVRISALSFLVPGLAYLLIAGTGPLKARWKGLLWATLLTSALLGPFVLNCWRTFGDPLYAINVHADVYRATEGSTAGGDTAASFLARHWRAMPAQTADTIVLGLTTYPFQNKWRGFEPWHPALGVLLSWAAVAGVVLFTGSPHGRLLIVVLVTSLIPYAATWRLIADWRFTAHAYPFFLTAAFYAFDRVLRLPSSMRTLGARSFRPDRRSVVFWALVLFGIAGGVFVVRRTLPWLVARESLQTQQSVTILAGARDGAFFGGQWTSPKKEGNVTVRISESSSASIQFPLPTVRDYTLLLRLDPFSGGQTLLPPLPGLRVYLNRQLVTTLALTSDAQRVGVYYVGIPAAVTTVGANQLLFEMDADDPREWRVRFWYLRISAGKPS